MESAEIDMEALSCLLFELRFVFDVFCDSGVMCSTVN